MKRKKRIRKPHQGTPAGVYPRSLGRSVAKHIMLRAGWTHINRHFRLNWKRVFEKQ